MAFENKKVRGALVRRLEGEATLFAQYAAATKSNQLKIALLRLCAAQLEVAAILRAHNGGGI